MTGVLVAVALYVAARAYWYIQDAGFDVIGAFLVWGTCMAGGLSLLGYATSRKKAPLFRTTVAIVTWFTAAYFVIVAIAFGLRWQPAELGFFLAAGAIVVVIGFASRRFTRSGMTWN